MDEGDEIEVLMADLARWTADARAEDAAQARTRERWLRRQAEEEARFAGMALDLAEAEAGVTVRTTTGRTLHGRVAAVARDFCVVTRDGGPPTFLALVGVATLRPEPGFRAGEAASERAAAVDAGLADVLAGLAAERPRVLLGLDGGGDPLSGELRAVGADVVTLRLDGTPGGTVYVQLAAVREVTLLG